MTRSRVLRRTVPLLALGLSALPLTASHAQSRVRTGIEVLVSDSLHLIRGKRVGLITNHTGVGPAGKSSVDILHGTPGVKLTALYGPEHGIRGVARAGDHVATFVDSATGVTVYSLYGETRVPTPKMLENVDVLLYDIQDVGARVYTYEWTMTLSAEAAKGKKFIVLDRPNPIRADRVDGGVLDAKYRSFVGWYPVALRYGLTVGELATYLVGTGQLKADITVVPMQGYRRDMWWSDTGLGWINPSPNIRSADAALLYPGTVMFEGTNLNEGRGMEMPFQMAGAPYLTDAGAIAAELNALKLPGVVFDSTSQQVEAGYKHGGLKVPVLMVVVSDREQVVPIQVGLHMLRAIYKRHPKDFQWRQQSIDRLFGSTRLRAAVEKEGGIEALLPILERESVTFKAATRPYWLYK
ncbi:MAG: DUF1343 domain-containing protein [Gemmatimonadaceae bacterium]|nr:DUF1343 domain-containing protein [Gemmatimonadaceae bacterium]